VRGLAATYAAGDATDAPIKHGGIACEQADTIAAHIAAGADADVVPAPIELEPHGRLLVGAHRDLLRVGPAVPDESAKTTPLWWPPTKVTGVYLSPWLAAHAQYVPAEPKASDRDVEVTARARRRRFQTPSDKLSLAPYAPVAESR
jgi:hypothetical protein